jgi:hypothetical protein
VDFVNYTTAQRGKIIPLADAEKKIIQTSDGKPYSSINGINLGDGRVISLDGKRTVIRDVWDLAMLGAEREEIEHRYRIMTDGPAVFLGDQDGILVNRPDGTWSQLLQIISDSHEYDLWNLLNDRTYDRPDKFYPAQTFPSDAVLVVRTSALHDLEALISEPETSGERPIGQRERNTLLVIIAALANLAKVEFTKPSKAAMTIESETIRMRSRVAARTIEDHLNRIPDALDSKAD